MPNDCILLGIDETKSTTFAFMRNDAVQINLVQFLKYYGWKFWQHEISTHKRMLQFLDH